MLLTDLPSEILLIISKSLPSTRDVLRFASCSHRLWDLLLPQAYSCITINSGCISSLSRLATLLIRKPLLASRVRCLHICPLTHPCKHKCKARYNPGSVDSILSKLRYTENEKEEWNDSLIGYGDAKWDQEDAWWAMLWTMLPNIEELDVSWDYGTEYRERILKRMAPPHVQFNLGLTLLRLREVTLSVSANDFATWISSEDALLFFRLPALETFSGYHIIEPATNVDDDTDEESPTGFSAVTNIQLHSSNSLNGFIRLSRACAMLKSIVYHHSAITVSERLFDAPAFHKSVSHHKSTLHSISMNGNPGFGMGMGSTFFGSLLDFTTLKNLSIPAMCILDWCQYENAPLNHVFDVLPASLECLAIEDFHHCLDKMDLTKQLEDVLKATPERYPNLRDLNLEGHFCDKTKHRADIDPENPSFDPDIMRLGARLAFICFTMSPVDFGIFDTVYGWVAPEHFCPCCLAGPNVHPEDLVSSEYDEGVSDDEDEYNHGDINNADDSNYDRSASVSVSKTSPGHEV
ncbi:hypothetical protein BJX64DRAFT_270766 [Aspergillus heterothallicus]